MLGETFIKDFNVLQLCLFELENQDLALILDQLFKECLEDVDWPSQVREKDFLLTLAEERLNFALEN